VKSTIVPPNLYNPPPILFYFNVAISLKNRDLISIEDLSKEELLFLLELASEMEVSPGRFELKDKVMATLFFEPSTRTRLSFESAMLRLGGKVLGFNNPNVTSVSKGETLYDTIKMVHTYADIIVIRHYFDGAARLAAEASDIPVINAGDGANQHPTQTLLDLYTIKKSQGKLENLNIVMCGDLKYGRTVHSLAKTLAFFDARLFFVSPPSLKIPNHLLEELKEKNIECTVHTELSEALEKADIIYATRIQKERFIDQSEYEKVKNSYVIRKDMLTNAKPNMKILHPLPRVSEIDRDVDDTKHAYYFEQAKNAVPIRKALIYSILK
jgi:aspartate carbamoyltransferase catalytic subunit